MIQIEKLHIEEFRGIRSLDLDLGCQNFVIYGPNGSGKSGVVDAIEFALTGSISRLSGEGSAGVTILRHAPHVYRRSEPEVARVALAVTDVESGHSAVLTRSVQGSTGYTLAPDDPVVRQALQDAIGHPELVLSRREILRFVVATAGNRANEVQALLKLDAIEATRRALKAAETRASTESASADHERCHAERSFTEHLQLPSLVESAVLTRVNERRLVLGLEPLGEFTLEADVLAGMAAPRPPASINIATARRDVEALRDAVEDDEQVTLAFDNLASELEAFRANPRMVDAIRHLSLFESGLAAVEGPECPLCGLAWESRELLEEHLRGQIAGTKEAQQTKEAIVTAGAVYRTELRAVRETAGKVTDAARAHGPDMLSHEIKVWTDSLSQIEGGLGTFDAIAADDADHSVDAHVPPVDVVSGLAELAKALNDLPDESATDEARSYLDVARDRRSRVRIARKAAAKAKAVKEAADAVYAGYCEAADQALGDLYRAVEGDFSRYYQAVNADDEGSFKAELAPSTGSLELTVDFYELGMFPPLAYHSEGHQDGMGVCLYLALVKQLLGDDFRFAVLDDVVMSVDTGHRRRFAELLKSEFPGVQFVITTHDEVWARQMATVGLVARSGMARFHGWTVGSGPMYGMGDAWSAIDADLANADVPSAAAKLRRALEASAADIAEGLRGEVPYRADANYDLSVFLSAIKGRLRKLLGLAAASGQSWGNYQQKHAVEALQARRGQVVPDEEAEEWIINRVVHSNDWANVSVADFGPVLAAVKDFLRLFRCDNPECGSWIAVSGRPGREESLRCACAGYDLNLLKR